MQELFRKGIISSKPPEKVPEHAEPSLPYKKATYPSMVHPIPDVGVSSQLAEMETRRIMDKLRAVIDGKGEHRATAEIKAEKNRKLDQDVQKKILDTLLKAMQKEEENLIEQNAMKKVRDEIAEALKRQAERLDATAETPDAADEISSDDLEDLRRKILAERTEES